MRDIRESPRMMGYIRLEMEAAIAKAIGSPTVKWLRGDGLDATYRVTLEPSGDRTEGTLTHLFEHFGLALPALWQHALRLEAEETQDADYRFSALVDPVHGERLYFNVLDDGSLDCGSPSPQCGNGCSGEFELSSCRCSVICEECRESYTVDHA